MRAEERHHAASAEGLDDEHVRSSRVGLERQAASDGLDLPQRVDEPMRRSRDRRPARIGGELA